MNEPTESNSLLSKRHKSRLKARPLSQGQNSSFRRTVAEITLRASLVLANEFNFFRGKHWKERKAQVEKLEFYLNGSGLTGAIHTTPPKSDIEIIKLIDSQILEMKSGIGALFMPKYRKYYNDLFSLHKELAGLEDSLFLIDIDGSALEYALELEAGEPDPVYAEEKNQNQELKKAINQMEKANSSLHGKINKSEEQIRELRLRDHNNYRITKTRNRAMIDSYNETYRALELELEKYKSEKKEYKQQYYGLLRENAQLKQIYGSSEEQTVQGLSEDEQNFYQKPFNF